LFRNTKAAAKISFAHQKGVGQAPCKAGAEAVRAVTSLITVEPG